VAADIGTVMDAIGSALDGITGLRVYDFPAKSAQPPFAVVDLPETIEYDNGMTRGSDRCTLNVVIGVANIVDRTSRDKICTYAAGSGAASVKTVLEASGIGNSLRVTQVQFRTISFAGSLYLGAVFTLDIDY
jgi:hypothetical protein